MCGSINIEDSKKSRHFCTNPYDESIRNVRIANKSKHEQVANRIRLDSCNGDAPLDSSNYFKRHFTNVSRLFLTRLRVNAYKFMYT